MHETLMANLIEFVARNELAETLLNEHSPDERGRCVCCKSGAYSYTPWPCTTRVAAARAAELAVLPRRR